MQKPKEYASPIPRDDFAKMVGGSWDWIRKLIDKGTLPALELVQDKETLESVLIPYTSKRAKQQSLFIDPNVAAYYCDSLSKLARGPNEAARGPRGPRGWTPTEEAWDTALRDGTLVPYDQQSYVKAKREHIRERALRQEQPHIVNEDKKKRYPPKLDQLLKNKQMDNTQIQSNMVAPVPLAHLAKRAQVAVGSLFNAIHDKTLHAVEFVFDEELKESKLVPYVPKDEKRQGKAVYVMPDEARRFVEEEQRKRDGILETLASPPTMPIFGRIPRDEEWEEALRKGTLAPYDPSQGTNVPHPTPIREAFEQEVLEIARGIKAQSGGTVERVKILEALSGGKRNNMYLAKKIKYVMDQHIDEFPPHRSGPHAFLSKKS